jgi:hypothetical protein
MSSILNFSDRSAVLRFAYAHVSSVSIHTNFPNGDSAARVIAAFSMLVCIFQVALMSHSVFIQPRPGIGIYFGADAASPHTLFPRSSNGFAAADTTLLTPFAAMNAIQIKRSAIISTIIVPKIPPQAPIIFTVSFAAAAYLSISVARIFPLNMKSMPQIDIIFCVSILLLALFATTEESTLSFRKSSCC